MFGQFCANRNLGVHLDENYAGMCSASQYMKLLVNDLNFDSQAVRQPEVSAARDIRELSRKVLKAGNVTQHLFNSHMDCFDPADIASLVQIHNEHLAEATTLLVDHKNALVSKCVG